VKRKMVRLLAAMVALVTIGVGTNWLCLQRPVSHALSQDPRNDGITAWIHYQYGVNPRRVVFDLREISASKSRADVFRVLLQFAESQKDRHYRSVILSCRGEPKFLIPGDYFRTLGEEYDFQNPVYTMRTFPYEITTIDGQPVFQPPQGGLLYVLGVEIEDFTEFHDRWYMDEMPL